MGLYKLKQGVYYHQGRRIAANDRFGNNVLELADDSPMAKEKQRWERIDTPYVQPVAAVAAPAHNPSEVLTSETVEGGLVPGVTGPADNAVLDGPYDPTATPERDAVADSSFSSPLRDWYTYTIPQAVHHVRAASDLTTLAQYKNLELAPKQGKQRGKVLEAIDERAGELKLELK